MNLLLQDMKFSLRVLVKRPGFAIAAIFTLALGVGANTAIFSVVDAVLLRPVPYPAADRLVFLWSTMVSQGVPISGSSMPDYREWRDQNSTLQGLAGFYFGSFNLSSTGAQPENLIGAYVTSNLFDVLRVRPAAGRNFSAEQDQFGRHHAVLLSYGLWQRRFAGNPGIVGREIKVGGESYNVAGIMPRGMPFFDNLPDVDIFAPIAFAPGDDLDTRGNHFVILVGRLKDGVSVAQAQQDASRVASHMQETYAENKGLDAKVVSLSAQLTGDSRRPLLVLLGAVAFVLLIACVNVANLMLARAASREREFAIRTSLGASRLRIVRQLVMECLPVSLIAAGAGMMLALWGVDLLSSALPSSLPRFNTIAVNGEVLGFTLAIAILTLALAGLAPALQVANSDIQTGLSEGGRSGAGGGRQGRLRQLLVGFEVAAALVLLVCAGLMIRSFIKLKRMNVGFAPHNVLTMNVTLPDSKYPVPINDNDRRIPTGLVFFDKLLGRIQSLPGVTGVAEATQLPLDAGAGWSKFMSIEGRPSPSSLDQVPLVRFALVSPGYFGTLGIAFQAGREFEPRDDENSQQVAIINETLAKRFFPGENPIGKTVWMGPPQSLVPRAQATQGYTENRRIIVGVAADVKGGALNQPTQSFVYAPLHQFRHEGYTNGITLAVRSDRPVESITAAIRQQVSALDSDEAVADVNSMDQLLDKALSASRFTLMLLGLFATLALVLAAIGIYGVMSFVVVHRTHEIGLRMALGSRQGEVLGLILRQGVLLVVTGVACGGAAAWALTRLMAGLLYNVSATDPVTFVAIALFLVGVATIACWIPARRAARVDPMVALRIE